MNDGDQARAALNNFVVNCPELGELESLLGKFNIFRVLGIEHMEIRHSNMLAWLLTPSESHGLYDSFLKKFLIYASNQAVDNNQNNLPEPVEIDALEIQSIETLREWKNIDLLINLETKSEKWLFVIENKVNSRQRPDQLKDYRERVEVGFENHQKYYLLLSKNPEEPEEDAFINVSYALVHKAIISCVSERKESIGDGPLNLIKDYIELLEHHFMEESRVSQLSKVIYRAHKLAIDTIIQNRPKVADYVSVFLERKIKERQDLVLMPSNQTYLRFIPGSWNQERNLRGDAWGDNGAYILIEIRVRANRPSIKIVSGRAPFEWARMVFEQTSNGKFARNNRTLKENQTWVTYDSLSSPVEIDEFEIGEADIDQACQEIWEWVDATISGSDYLDKIRIIENLIHKLP